MDLLESIKPVSRYSPIDYGHTFGRSSPGIYMALDGVVYFLVMGGPVKVIPQLKTPMLKAFVGQPLTAARAAKASIRSIVGQSNYPASPSHGEHTQGVSLGSGNTNPVSIPINLEFKMPLKYVFCNTHDA